jgi:uncharacterized protein YlxP (DUF503 family)
MFVGIARYDLRFPESSSLKDKRSVVRQLSSMLHQKFRCSIAEVGDNDLRQRGSIGIALVSDSSFHARQVLASVARHVETHPGVEIISETVDVVSPEDLS